MESINDCSKLIARALDLFKSDVIDEGEIYHHVAEAIPLLEQALEKLTSKM